MLKLLHQCAAGYTVLVSAATMAKVALRPSDNVLHAAGAAVLALLKAMAVFSPVAFGATITRYFAMTDQSVNVPAPPTLVTFRVRVVPAALVTTPIILLAGFARLRTSSAWPAYTSGVEVMSATANALLPVPMVVLVAD